MCLKMEQWLRILNLFQTFKVIIINVQFVFQELYILKPYLSHQPKINASMRAILIDWLVEVQENFELYHETLYLAVKIVDHFLEKNAIERDQLQLLGATAVFLACKIEVTIFLLNCS